jgi:hypothetical protein
MARPVWNPVEQAKAARAYEARKQFTATHPSLHLVVYCTFEGVHLRARVDHLDEKGRLQTREIAKATWQPKEVSEGLVVQWGERALRAWLEANLPTSQDPT